MAGYTDFSVGLIRNYPVMIPLNLLIAQSSRMLKRNGFDWLRLIQSTGQPSFLSRENMTTYLTKEKEREMSRKDQYIKVKMQALDPNNRLKLGNENDIVGSAGNMNY